MASIARAKQIIGERLPTQTDPRRVIAPQSALFLCGFLWEQPLGLLHLNFRDDYIPLGIAAGADSL
jgi:hypothetical protein